MNITVSPKQAQNETETAERTRPRNVYRPPVDIIEAPDAILLVADVPGVSERDVEVSLEQETLTLRARVEPPPREGYALVASEYGLGDWERTFTISSEIDRDRIEASVKDGVLRIRLPKSTAAASRKISVKAG